ncbi:MAG: hypothetical protein PF589_05945 [Gammaproteobacteria bacterium]|nr:hypothetical protein [Gammaproteobacteria bacterium]
MSAKNESMHGALTAGRVGHALAIAEQQDLEHEDVLASLNKGMLRRMTGDYEQSNRFFEIAKQQIKALYGVSVSEQAGALIVNDTMRGYAGDRYEQVLLHAYMAMNYIQLNDFDSARVEMLQADIKMQEWGEQPEEDPFVRYLSGMIYEALGEKDQALVSYRKAKEAYKSTKDKQGLGIPLTLNHDLLRLLAEQGLENELSLLKKEFKLENFKPKSIPKGYGELIVVVNSGLAPTRKAASIVTSTGGEVVDTVKVSVPQYLPSKQPYSIRLTTDRKVSASLEPVENVDALARAALNDDMPLIMTRAIARAVVKHKSQKEAEKRGGAMMGFLATVANMVTEQADTRSWTTLPQTIQLTRLKLPVGMNKINVEIYNASGTLVDTIEKKVQIKSGKSVFLSEHWVAPNMVSNVVADKQQE